MCQIVLLLSATLHADLKATQELFSHIGLTNADGAWIAKDTVVVQTGDVTDRGPDGKNMLEWLQQQQLAAQQHSSKLIILMGNHESMNIRGDWRYVSPKDIQSFGSLDERKAALQPQAEWGLWLANLPTTAQIQDTIFVHGGISPHYAAPSSSINDSVRKAHLGVGDPEHFRLRRPIMVPGLPQSTGERCLSKTQAGARKDRGKADGCWSHHTKKRKNQNAM